MKNHIVLVFVSFVLSIACEALINKEQKGKTKFVTLEKRWETDALFTTPESVIFDGTKNVLYVSNIGRVPTDSIDHDGYISILSPEGKVLKEYWVTGLSAPKGMGILGNSLFVTDVNEVVEIDIPSGHIRTNYRVQEALFLNDITIGDNKVFVSDSYTNKIHVIENQTLSLWSEDITFGNPNGLLFEPGRLKMASFGTGQFFDIDLSTKKTKVLTDSLGGGDGVVTFNNGYIVSDWNGRVFNILSDGSKKLLLDTRQIKKQTADIWFDSTSQTLYIATFFGNTVSAYSVY